MNAKDYFRDFFSFRPSDRRAVIALCCMAVFAIGVLLIVDAINGQREFDELNGSEVAETKVDTLYGSEEAVNEWKQHGIYSPNNENGSSRRRGGERRENRAENFSTSHNNSDGKTYSGNSSNSNSHKFTSLTKIDVNSADSALLCRVPGIGAARARAIVNYRKKLGGFLSEEQLLEINIFPAELQEWFFVKKPVEVRKLDVNCGNFKEVNAHPYISYDQTKSLFQYIRLYGDIKDAESLRQTKIFTDEELEHLIPYLEFR